MDKFIRVGLQIPPGIQEDLTKPTLDLCTGEIISLLCFTFTRSSCQTGGSISFIVSDRLNSGATYSPFRCELVMSEIIKIHL